MTTDYAKRRRTTAKKKPKKKSGSYLILWLITLLLFVLFTIGLVYLGKYQHSYRIAHRKVLKHKTQNVTPIANQTAAPTPATAQFDFYTILPQKKNSTLLTTYELEIKITKEYSVADHLKAQLALLGFSVNITPITINGAEHYRITIGPYGTKADAVSDQTRLKQNKIYALIRIIK